MNEILIRPLLPEEVSQLTNFLYHAVFVPDEQQPPPLSIVRTPFLQAYIEDFGKRQQDYALVAEKHGQIIGAVWVRILDDPLFHTPTLAFSLLPAYRGQGIGTALFSTMLDTLKQKDMARVCLSVQKQNPAFRLYQRAGFSLVEDRGDEAILLRFL